MKIMTIMLSIDKDKEEGLKGCFFRREAEISFIKSTAEFLHGLHGWDEYEIKVAPDYNPIGSRVEVKVKLKNEDEGEEI